MVTRDHYGAVAEQLKERIENRAFATIPRRDVTNILREVSGEERTRIKSIVARDLSTVLEENGLRFYPPLETTDTRDNLRLFRIGSVLDELVEVIVHPSPLNDAKLGASIKKIKGTWKWHNNKAQDLQPVA